MKFGLRESVTKIDGERFAVGLCDISVVSLKRIPENNGDLAIEEKLKASATFVFEKDPTLPGFVIFSGSLF